MSPGDSTKKWKHKLAELFFPQKFHNSVFAKSAHYDKHDHIREIPDNKKSVLKLIYCSQSANNINWVNDEFSCILLCHELFDRGFVNFEDFVVEVEERNDAQGAKCKHKEACGEGMDKLKLEGGKDEAGSEENDFGNLFG